MQPSTTYRAPGSRIPRGNWTFHEGSKPSDTTCTRMRPPCWTHSTTTPPAGAAATDTVATAEADAAGVNTGSAAADFTSTGAGTEPCWAAAIACSVASTQTSDPSVVTRYSRSSKYCMESADPPPVPSFHSRRPSASKQ